MRLACLLTGAGVHPGFVAQKIRYLPLYEQEKEVFMAVNTHRRPRNLRVAVRGLLRQERRLQRGIRRNSEARAREGFAGLRGPRIGEHSTAG